MPRIKYIHWHADEARERAERLSRLGHTVDHEPPRGPATLRALAEDPPDAIVIDLARVPSQGRDVDLSLRQRAGTRSVPLVFVSDPARVPADKVARIRELLPDAAYATWERIAEALTEAMAHPPTDPVVPGSTFAAYRGRALVDKLGVGPGDVVALVDPPPGFAEVLGDLPKGARIARGPTEDAALTMWFVRTAEALTAAMDGIVAAAASAPVWIAWPKRASALRSDLTQPVVRHAGLDAGLVDYKICAVDDTWSALLFTRRKNNETAREGGA